VRVRAGWLRFAGLILLGFLIWKLDASSVYSAIQNTQPTFLAAAILLNIPQIFTKALRWRYLMLAQGIQYNVASSVLAYFGSIFIGLLTPGRLGEFVKTVHVSRDCGIPAARAFSSVLVDRLFDLYALLLFGSAAIFSTAQQQSTALLFAEAALLLVLPILAILHRGTFERLQAFAMKTGKIGKKLFGEGSWLQELRLYLISLRLSHILIAIFFTALAYAMFFSQCYLLARGMNLDVPFLTICFAVALGSLVTLIPISISGLGTREAVMIAYLGRHGVSAELSLGYSLLIFVTFYLAGGIMGAVAWLIKPAPLSRKT
jgi:uncharacterized protein (TIRG00374 family)